MANHAWVKTRKHMSPQAVTDLLNKLNEKYFQNVLKIEYHNCQGEEECWGEHVWTIKAEERNAIYVERVCWLKHRQHFEIRHGGGGDFAWWVDFTVTAQVAKTFNGRQYDDGCGEIKDRKIFPTYSEFVEHMHPPRKGFKKAVRRWIIHESKQMAPAEFRGKKK